MTRVLGVWRHDPDDPRCEPPIEPVMEICDPHHHLMDREWIRYGVGDLVADLGAGQRVTSTVYVECSAAYRRAGPPELRSVGETEHVVGQPAPPGVMRGVVANVDLALGPGVERVLEAHLAVAGERLRGIRYSTAWHPDRDNGARVPGMLADDRVHAGIAVLGRFGLPLDCWVHPHQLDEVGAVAGRFPEQRLIVDHLGTPLAGLAGVDDWPVAREAWRSGMARLARHDNVLIKIGGLAGIHMGGPWTVDDRPSSAQISDFWHDDVTWCIDTFGPRRCMAESNFPIDGMVVDYVTLWNALKRLVASYSAAERSAVLHDTAVDSYSLDPSKC
jgi:L-fuconolactonase